MPHNCCCATRHHLFSVNIFACFASRLFPLDSFHFTGKVLRIKLEEKACWYNLSRPKRLLVGLGWDMMNWIGYFIFYLGRLD